MRAVGHTVKFGIISLSAYMVSFDIVSRSLEESEDILPDNPAVFETEPKESKDLGIYYEATGAIPMVLDESNIQDAFPLGSYIQFSSSTAPTTYNPIVIDWIYILKHLPWAFRFLKNCTTKKTEYSNNL